MSAQPTPDVLKSPFPGMDPYLEAQWNDVHPSISIYARNQIQHQLPGGLVARIERYVSLHCEDDDGDSTELYRPDVLAFEETDAARHSGTAVATAAPTTVETGIAAEPVYVPRPEPVKQRRVKVMDSASGKLITVIEILSPSNKRGGQALEFRDKQEAFLCVGVNVVEIDLLRRGHWVLSSFEDLAPESVMQPYRICVVRGHRRTMAEMYTISLREPLPTIRIPLRAKDTDVLLNVQKLVDDAYIDGRYCTINYNRPPDPPLTGEDAEWADALLKSKGKRTNNAS